jgi:tRNA threonylcarbamoyladenosine biosynthesis protein TsaB
MRTLAIDTCFGALSIAMGWRDADGATQIAHRWEARQTGHAERLFPLIAEVLSEAGLARADVDRVAATLGPGSFTGVRIAIATARAFRLASGCQLVGVSSLEVMARTATRHIGPAVAGRDLVVAVDARRGEAYVQRFASTSSGRLDAPELLAIEEAAALLPACATVIVGSGGVALAGAARARGIEAEALLPTLEPDALDLLALAPGLAPRDTLVPLYVRAPDAKPPASAAIRRAASETSS